MLVGLGIEWTRTEIGNLQFEIKQLKNDISRIDIGRWEHRNELVSALNITQYRVRELEKKEEYKEVKKPWLVDFVMSTIQQVDAPR